MRRHALIGSSLVALLVCSCRTETNTHAAAASATSATTRLKVASSPVPSASIHTERAAAGASATPIVLDEHARALVSIARDIEAQKPNHPALDQFEVDKHLDTEWLRILYERRVQRKVITRGIKRESAVVPDPQGLYLYIDFHENVARNEAHSQVFRGYFQHGDRRVMYVTRVGNETGRLDAELSRIMRKHGVRSLGLGGPSAPPPPKPAQ
jgi:hypothetical protein